MSIVFMKLLISNNLQKDRLAEQKLSFRILFLKLAIYEDLRQHSVYVGK